MRLIKIFLVCLFASGLHSQNIVRVEYYIDEDPGYNNGISVPLNTGKMITVNFDADVSDLAPGFHQLYIRALDDNGCWSLTYIKSFYLDKRWPEHPDIVRIEYSIDQGEVHAIDVTPDDIVSENFIVELTGVSPGFHVLFLWATDNSGLKSLLFEKNFYVDQDRIAFDINAVEYYFSQTDTIMPVNVFNSFSPAGNIELDMDLNIANLQYGENYLLHICGQDQNGLRSLEYIREIMVGSGNSAPELSDLPEHIEFDADSSYVLNLFDHVHDYETPDSLLTYKFDLSSDSIALMINIFTGELTLSAYPAYSGSDTLWITVIDDSAASDQAMILVTVHPATALDYETTDILPTRFSLAQNYPNPFNPVTRIRFALPVPEDVILEIFNVRGQKVITLIKQEMPAGFHEINFIPENLSSGIFFYRLKAGAFYGIRKMIYLR